MTRIIINPDSLRGTARGLNEAASEYGLLARAIGAEDVQAVSPDIRGFATSVAQQSRSDLVQVSSELSREADRLRGRADLVEQSQWYSALLGTVLPLPATSLSWLAGLYATFGDATGAVRNLGIGLNAVIAKWGNRFGRGYAFRTTRSSEKQIRDVLRVLVRGKGSNRLMALARATGPLNLILGWQGWNAARSDLGVHKYSAAQKPGEIDRDDIETASDALQMDAAGTAAVGGGLMLVGLASAVTGVGLVPGAASFVSGGALLAVSGVETIGALGLDAVADHWDGAREGWEKTRDTFGWAKGKLGL